MVECLMHNFRYALNSLTRLNKYNYSTLVLVGQKHSIAASNSGFHVFSLVYEYSYEVFCMVINY
jgi:hypothetical protein